MKYTINIREDEVYTFNGVVNAITHYAEEKLIIEAKDDTNNRRVIERLKSHDEVEVAELRTIGGVNFYEIYVEPFTIKVVLLEGAEDLLDSFDNDIFYYTIGADGETYERDFYVILDKENSELFIYDEMVDIKLDINYNYTKEEHLDKLRSILEEEIKTLGYTIEE